MKAMRMRKQKKIILDVLRSTKSHPTADWVYTEARKLIPNLSLGTVYRNLKVLKEMGEILELNYGSTYSRFDGNPENHYHFVCQKCGNVYDLDLPINRDLNEAVMLNSNFEVKDHRLEFYGLRENCKS